MTTTTCMLCHRLLPKKSMLHIWGRDYICNFRKDKELGLQCDEIEDAIFFFRLDRLQPNSKGITNCDF